MDWRSWVLELEILRVDSKFSLKLMMEFSTDHAELSWMEFADHEKARPAGRAF